MKARALLHISSEYIFTSRKHVHVMYTPLNPIFYLAKLGYPGVYGATFEIRGNSKFGVIYIFNSFSLSVKCSEKILTSVETLMFALSNGIKIVSEQQCCASSQAFKFTHSFFQQGKKANS